MDYRKKLFTTKNPYDLPGTEGEFLRAMALNAEFHINNCPEYARICRQEGFSPKRLSAAEDLKHIPPIPTLYFKRNNLYSMPDSRFMVHATSTGTGGKRSETRFELRALLNGARMVFNTTRFHGLLSPVPVNYVILGYKATRKNQMGVAKTALLSTFYAPALSRTYALKETGGGYEPDFEDVCKALEKCAKSLFPTRFMAFPSYTLFLLREMERLGMRLRLRPRSRFLLGGGWKQFYAEEIDRHELYALIGDRLGIPETNCTELFGAAEHPVLYCDCPNHHFHVPIYSRVLIRDVATLEPLPYGRAGLANFMTPMLESMPLLSIMTDDLCVLRDGNTCGCGIRSPFFEILGRVGVADIKTCTAGAEDILREAII